MIRKFEEKDLEDIVSIYDKVKLDRAKLNDPAYCAKVQKNGFLLGLDTPDDTKQEIEKSFVTMVYEDDKKVLGYLIVDHGEDQKFIDDEYKFWFDENLKKDYYKSPKGMSIASVCVDPDSSKKGIATNLFNELEKRLKKEGFEYIYSIITLAPLTNCATIIWHTKNGFSRLAMGRPRKLWNLDNYVGVLMYKKII